WTVRIASGIAPFARGMTWWRIFDGRNRRVLDPDQARWCVGERAWSHGQAHPDLAGRARARDRNRGRPRRRRPRPGADRVHAAAGEPQDHPAVRARYRPRRGPVPCQLLLRGQAGAIGGGRLWARGRAARLTRQAVSSARDRDPRTADPRRPGARWTARRSPAT